MYSSINCITPYRPRPAGSGGRRPRGAPVAVVVVVVVVVVEVVVVVVVVVISTPCSGVRAEVPPTGIGETVSPRGGERRARRAEPRPKHCSGHPVVYKSDLLGGNMCSQKIYDNKYMFIHIHVCIYIYIYIFVYLFMYLYVYIYIYIYMFPKDI